MSNFNTHKLTKKGSITFHGTEGVVHYDKGDTVTSAKEFKAIPKRQQAFFEVVEEEEESKSEAEPSLEEQVADEFTVEQLQDKLTEAEVDFKSDAKKDALVQLYIEHVHED